MTFCQKNYQQLQDSRDSYKLENAPNPDQEKVEFEMLLDQILDTKVLRGVIPYMTLNP